jgi:hypothetical protein
MLAWLLFGGVGARTTRGLGHLFVPSTITREDVSRIEGKLGVIARRLDWQGKPDNPAAAWQAAIAEYRGFRQLRNPRSTKGRGPGRSYWPKADVIRALTDRALTDPDGVRDHAVQHAAVTTGKAREAPDTRWPLPEVHYGAPIILKFKDDDEKAGDPYPVELVPARSAESVYDRFTSPVLTIPWWDVGASCWRPRIVALPYEGDLAGVGVCLRKSGEGEGGASNVFKYLSSDGGKTAYVKPGGWWPAKQECGEAWGSLVASIWRGTPGSDPNAKDLRAMGAVDPVEALFKFLKRP